ncbi:MAG: hypothetical protein ACPG32_06950 [Akkermansiaceae bacterium]
MRQLLGLIIGIVVGTAGAVLFMQSQPPEEGSDDEKLMLLEKELFDTKRLVLQYESGKRRPGNRGNTASGLRMIAEDLRDGKDVSMDDVFTTMKPWMRDLAPLFDRMRVRDQTKRFDEIAGEFRKKYNLSPQHMQELKAMFAEQAKVNTERFNNVVRSNQTGMVDLIQATRDWETDPEAQAEMDAFMEARLQGDELEKYRADRLDERYQNVVAEANRKFHRIDDMVGLDDTQKDQVFGLMVRSAEGYENGMEYEGMGAQRGVLSREQRNEALLSVLTPEQRESYQAETARRQEEALKDLQAIGLKPPKNWELLDKDDL